MKSTKKTHTCGELTKKEVGATVTLMGWVHTRRDHGGLIFVDLRDRGGITQVVFNPETSADAHKLAHEIRSEFVLAVTGKVSPRPGNTVNPKLPTGEIEVIVNDLAILNQAKTPPFMIEDETDVAENLRLKYRYLDLRRPSLQKVLITRHKITQTVRRFLDSQGFIGHRDTVPYKEHARRRTGLSGPEQGEPRHVLCAPAVAPALQADPDGCGVRALLPDREVLPRRGPSRRPSA